MEASEKKKKLFMLLLGASPIGRFTEQHDIFFGIAEEIKDLKQDLMDFWPEAGLKLHIDGWREVNLVNGFQVKIVPRGDDSDDQITTRLFFINLGGYKQNEFEEYHYKIIVAAKDKGEAVQSAKQTSFYKHTGFKGADSHIDDKYGVDVDDLYEITDILPAHMKQQYRIVLTPADAAVEDEIHLGYLKLSKLED